MSRAHLILCAAVVAALTIWAGCYPVEPCPGPCGTSFSGTDCHGFSAEAAATVAAFDTCHATVSSADACANLDGTRVRVLPQDQTQVDSLGRRYFPAPPGNHEAADGGDLTEAFGLTDCWDHSITLADETWASGVAATELIHVATYDCATAYEGWGTDGKSCVVATARAAPTVLTGSVGEDLVQLPPGLREHAQDGVVYLLGGEP